MAEKRRHSLFGHSSTSKNVTLLLPNQKPTSSRKSVFFISIHPGAEKE